MPASRRLANFHNTSANYAWNHQSSYYPDRTYEKDYFNSAFWLIRLSHLFEKNTKVMEHNSNGKRKSLHLIAHNLRMRSLSSSITSLHYWLYLYKNSLSSWSTTINLTFPVWCGCVNTSMCKTVLIEYWLSVVTPFNPEHLTGILVVSLHIISIFHYLAWVYGI